MTNIDSPAQDVSWFVRHLVQYGEAADQLPELDQLGRAMNLFLYASRRQTVFPNDSTFPNDMAGSACMARAAQQLEATTVLVSYGFHAEVRNLLRSVYESVGLGRTLAKARDKREMADKWLKDGVYWPDKIVRRWLDENQVVEPGAVEDYRSMYREMCAWAHPMARSCMGLFADRGDALELIPEPAFDLELCRQTIVEIAATAVFACFAFRNALAKEEVIDPAWRRDLKDLAEELAGQPLPHLERDWVAEHERYDAMIARLRTMDELDEMLRQHPRSFDNLSKPGGDPPDAT